VGRRAPMELAKRRVKCVNIDIDVLCMAAVTRHMYRHFDGT